MDDKKQVVKLEKMADGLLTVKRDVVDFTTLVEETDGYLHLKMNDAELPDEIMRRLRSCGCLVFPEYSEDRDKLCVFISDNVVDLQDKILNMHVKRVLK